MLNKSISGSIKFHNLSDDTCRLLATWTIAHLDMRGVFYGDAAMVRSIVFPRRADVCIERVEGYLQELEAVGLMYRFEAKGDIWQAWPGFGGEQIGMRPDRESSAFPEPAGMAPSPTPAVAGRLPEDCRKVSGNVPPQSKAKQSKESKDIGAGAPTVPSTFEQWRDGYRKAENPNGYAGWMLTQLYPTYYAGAVKPNYGMLAKLLKTHDAEYVLSLIFQNSARPPSGDPLRFVSGILAKRGNGAASMAVGLDLDELQDPDVFFGGQR
jgi:hypothetical protein